MHASMLLVIEIKLFNEGVLTILLFSSRRGNHIYICSSAALVYEKSVHRS